MRTVTFALPVMPKLARIVLGGVAVKSKAKNRRKGTMQNEPNGVSFTDLEAKFDQDIVPLREPNYVAELLDLVGIPLDKGSAIGWCPALEIFVAFKDGEVVKLDRSVVPGYFN